MADITTVGTIVVEIDKQAGVGLQNKLLACETARDQLGAAHEPRARGAEPGV